VASDSIGPRPDDWRGRQIQDPAPGLALGLPALGGAGYALHGRKIAADDREEALLVLGR